MLETNIIINIITLCISHKRNNSLLTIVQGFFFWNKIGNLRVIPASARDALLFPGAPHGLCLVPRPSSQPALEGQAALSCSHIPFASVGGGISP